MLAVAGRTLALQDDLHPLPFVHGHHRRVLPLVDDPFAQEPARIEDVMEHPVGGGQRQRRAPVMPFLAGAEAPFPIQSVEHLRHRQRQMHPQS